MGNVFCPGNECPDIGDRVYYHGQAVIRGPADINHIFFQKAFKSIKHDRFGKKAEFHSVSRKLL